MSKDSFVILFYNVLSVTVGSVSLYTKCLLKLNTNELKTLSEIPLISLSIQIYVGFFGLLFFKTTQQICKRLFLNDFHFWVCSS